MNSFVAVFIRLAIGIVVSVICFVVSYMSKFWPLTTNWLGSGALLLLALSALPMLGLYNLGESSIAMKRVARREAEENERFDLGLSWTFSSFLIGLPMLCTAVVTYLVQQQVI